MSERSDDEYEQNETIFKKKWFAVTFKVTMNELFVDKLYMIQLIEQFFLTGC